MSRIILPVIAASRRRTVSYLVSENFEGAGPPALWVIQQGSPDWDYTLNPMQGAQGLLLSASTPGWVYIPFTAQSTVWCFMRMRRGSTPTVSGTLISINNSGTASCARVGSVGGSANIELYGGATTFINTAGMPLNTSLAVWLQFIKGTGSNSVARLWVQTDGTEIRPTTPTAQVTNGTSTVDANRLGLQSQNSSTSVFDKIRVSAFEIGSNPL